MTHFVHQAFLWKIKNLCGIDKIFICLKKTVNRETLWVLEYRPHSVLHWRVQQMASGAYLMQNLNNVWIKDCLQSFAPIGEHCCQMFSSKSDHVFSDLSEEHEFFYMTGRGSVSHCEAFGLSWVQVTDCIMWKGHVVELFSLLYAYQKIKKKILFSVFNANFIWKMLL